MADRSTVSLSGCCFGDIDDPYGQVFDARHLKRAAAVRFFASKWGCDFSDVKCTTRYGRWLTRQEQWDDVGYEAWVDDIEERFACPACGVAVGEACDEAGLAIPCDERVALVPAKPPGDWEPDEYVPVWEFCEPGDDGARRIFICEGKEAA